MAEQHPRLKRLNASLETLRSNVKRFRRFRSWCMNSLFSLTVLCCIIDGFPQEQRSQNERFALAIPSISFAVSCMTSIAHYWKPLNTYLVGTLIELGCAITLLMLWIAVSIVILSPKNSIASYVNEIGVETIQYANLYFLTWWTLFTNAYLVWSFFHDITLMNMKLIGWMILFFACAILFGITYELKDGICDVDYGMICVRTKYGMFIGLSVGLLALIGLAQTYISEMTPKLGLLLSFPSAGFYNVGVILLTSISGPARFLGTIYFTTWSGAAISSLFFVNYFEETFLSHNNDDEDENDNIVVVYDDDDIDKKKNYSSDIDVIQNDKDDVNFFTQIKQSMGQYWQKYTSIKKEENDDSKKEKDKNNTNGGESHETSTFMHKNSTSVHKDDNSYDNIVVVEDEEEDDFVMPTVIDVSSSDLVEVELGSEDNKINTQASIENSSNSISHKVVGIELGSANNQMNTQGSMQKSSSSISKQTVGIELKSADDQINAKGSILGTEDTQINDQGSIQKNSGSISEQVRSKDNKTYTQGSIQKTSSSISKQGVEIELGSEDNKIYTQESIQKSSSEAVGTSKKKPTFSLKRRTWN